MTEKKLSERFTIDHNVINSSYTEVTEADIRTTIDTIVTPDILAERHTGSAEPPLMINIAGKHVECYIETYTPSQGSLVVWIGLAIPEQEPLQDEADRIISTSRCYWTDETEDGKRAEAQLISKLREFEHIRAHGDEDTPIQEDIQYKAAKDAVRRYVESSNPSDLEEARRILLPGLQ